MATLRTVPAPDPTRDRAAALQALLDRALAAKQAIRAITDGIDFYAEAKDYISIVSLHTSHAPEALLAAELWGSVNGCTKEVRTVDGSPTATTIIHPTLGPIVTVHDDGDETVVVDVDDVNLFV